MHLSNVVVILRHSRAFGHCNVPIAMHWGTGTVKSDQATIMQKGKQPKGINLSQDRIEKLDEIGFKWKLRYNH